MKIGPQDYHSQNHRTTTAAVCNRQTDGQTNRQTDMLITKVNDNGVDDIDDAVAMRKEKSEIY